MLFIVVPVRDRVKAAVEKSMDALMTSTTLSQRIDDVSRLVETQAFSKLNVVQSTRNVALGNVPQLGKILPPLAHPPGCH